MSESLGEAFPKEQARLRTLLGYYSEAGQAGAFASAMLEDCLRRADKAAVEQDTVAMLRLYKEMQEFKA